MGCGQLRGAGLPRYCRQDSLGFLAKPARSETDRRDPRMRDLLRHLTDVLERGREALLCQVVQTKGSTPQKAGALMLVDPDGGQVGTLGGGCVEAEVKQKAIRLLGRGGVECHSFLLDHDYAWADGLICGGKMVILAASLRGDGPAAYFRAY